MMKIHSLRWKLPLSYALIALVAAFSLGAVLLTVLRGYYARQERAYLENNARVIGAVTARTRVESLDNAQNNEQMESRLKSLAFISDTRIQLLDSDRNILIDSGPPRPTYIEFAPDEQAETSGTEMGIFLYAPNEDILTAPRDPRLAVEGTPSPRRESTPITGDFVFSYPMRPPLVVNDLPIGFMAYTAFVPSDSIELAFGVSAAHTPFGFQVSENPDAPGEDPRRSNETLDVALNDQDGSVVGYIRLLDGPAYGSEIVDRVAQTWLLASGVAVLLAATVGWFMSRQITNPLLALTETTRQMAAGDFAARAKMTRRDELGVLAATFDDMAARIENTVVMLRRFVANAAHELHTPLTALRTNLELVSEMSSDAVSARRALDQVQRLETLTDDLLDLSRIEAMSGDTPREPVDVAALARELSEVYASRAEQQDIDFALDLPPEALTVDGSPSQLRRLIANLLDNAVKFTPSGGRVDLCLARVDGHVELVVQDTGIGIPPDDLPFLFERFRRGRNAASYPGSGLGLAIVKAIAGAHSGTVRAASWASGTSVTVSLPAASTNRSASAA